MKFKYIKRGKMNYQGTQLHTGDVIEVDSLAGLPVDWFEVVKKKTVEKLKKKIEKEELEYGIDKDTNEDLGS